MRNKLVERIYVIKAEEDGFKSKWWKNLFVSYTPKSGEVNCAHVSVIPFQYLNDDDLINTSNIL